MKGFTPVCRLHYHYQISVLEAKITTPENFRTSTGYYESENKPEEPVHFFVLLLLRNVGGAAVQRSLGGFPIEIENKLACY